MQADTHGDQKLYLQGIEQLPVSSAARVSPGVGKPSSQRLQSLVPAQLSQSPPALPVDCTGSVLRLGI